MYRTPANKKRPEHLESCSVVAFFRSQEKTLALLGKLGSGFAFMGALWADPANPPACKTRAPHRGVEVDQKFDYFSCAERAFRAEPQAGVAEIHQRAGFTFPFLAPLPDQHQPAVP